MPVRALNLDVAGANMLPGSGVGEIGARLAERAERTVGTRPRFPTLFPRLSPVTPQDRLDVPAWPGHVSCDVGYAAITVPVHAARVMTDRHDRSG